MSGAPCPPGFRQMLQSARAEGAKEKEQLQERPMSSMSGSKGAVADDGGSYMSETATGSTMCSAPSLGGPVEDVARPPASPAAWSAAEGDDIHRGSEISTGGAATGSLVPTPPPRPPSSQPARRNRTSPALAGLEGLSCSPSPFPATGSRSASKNSTGTACSTPPPSKFSKSLADKFLGDKALKSLDRRFSKASTNTGCSTPAEPGFDSASEDDWEGIDDVHVLSLAVPSTPTPRGSMLSTSSLPEAGARRKVLPPMAPLREQRCCSTPPVRRLPVELGRDSMFTVCHDYDRSRQALPKGAAIWNQAGMAKTDIIKAQGSQIERIRSCTRNALRAKPGSDEAQRPRLMQR